MHKRSTTYIQQSRIYIIGALFAILAACNGREIVNSYSGYNLLPSDGWSYTRIEEFPLSTRDSIVDGTLLVALRHSGAYPFTDVQLEIDYTDLCCSHTDTITIPLTDPYGKWLGAGVGTSYQITDTVARFTHANGSGVKIRHLMRCDTLRGINQIGIFFVPN